MGLGLSTSARLRAAAQRLGARTLHPLPGRAAAGGRPNPLIVPEPEPALLLWDDQQLWQFDPRKGRVTARQRLPSPIEGLGEDGLPRLRDGAGEQWLRVSVAPLRLEPAGVDGALAARHAADSPELPEMEPFVDAGRRRYRARLTVTARVTRHMLEVCDEGHPPRELEVASYTLRSDRLRLVVHGPDTLRGHVGPEPLVPVASLAGGGRGEVLVARRRFSAWHEHIAGQAIDLVGHGPSVLELSVIPEGAGAPSTWDAGSLDEAWEGLDRRGPLPPALVRAIGVRAIGLLDGLALVELVEAAAPRSDRSRLVARRRALAALAVPGC